MAVFTVFAFGTGESRTTKKNIISQFSEACEGTILDVAEKYTLADNHVIVDGPSMLGTEVGPNAKRTAQQVIDWLMQQTEDENTVNLTGFSRGGVTCIEIANNLKARQLELERVKPSLTNEKDQQLLLRLQRLRLNIFAMDPVAGMGDKGIRERKVIPDNVKNCVAAFQLDEMRRDFKPQDMSRVVTSSGTDVSMLPMYGNHSDTTKTKGEGMESGAQLMWYTLYQFLTQHGTPFKGGRLPQIVDTSTAVSDLTANPTSKVLLRLFATHHKQRENYLRSGKLIKWLDGFPVPRVMRSLNRHLGFYVKNPDFFINTLERGLFKVSYPRVFNYLFERNQFDTRFPNDSARAPGHVHVELELLQRENPTLFTRLRDHGLVGVDDSNGNIKLGRPHGVYCLEPCKALRQMFPNMAPEAVKRGESIIDQLEELEAQVYHLTFQYERDKSSLQIYAKRGQAEQATALRDRVRDIVENQQGSCQEKYRKVLDEVEALYKRLWQSGSVSGLTSMLGTLLAEHNRYYQVTEASGVRFVCAEVVYASFSFLATTIEFVGTFAYVGGAVLAFVGTALQDFGRRCNDAIGNVGYNPIKLLLSTIAYTFEVVGYAIKNSLGVRAFTMLLTSCVQEIRDALVTVIEATAVVSVDAPNQTEAPHHSAVMDAGIFHHHSQSTGKHQTRVVSSSSSPTSDEGDSSDDEGEGEGRDQGLGVK